MTAFRWYGHFRIYLADYLILTPSALQGKVKVKKKRMHALFEQILHTENTDTGLSLSFSPQEIKQSSSANIETTVSSAEAHVQLNAHRLPATGALSFLLKGRKPSRNEKTPHDIIYLYFMSIRSSQVSLHHALVPASITGMNELRDRRCSCSNMFSGDTKV
ncbi:unnamed protein product [Nesidiocoris tenuis]|uniref:Uncharacterized protein n=1 Tax=Nesidiocoris tenuis TaxID=355587 RepID=A0A6H5GC13_9HEMI|nr:unnamed protein product [Nesidiocoris tenuis]